MLIERVTLRRTLTFRLSQGIKVGNVLFICERKAR